MKIENKEYLDYSDVLIKPKPTTINSRADVILVRSITGPASGMKFTTIPIIVANMDHTGTIEMALAVQGIGIQVALHKFYGFDDIITGIEKGLGDQHFISIGQNELDLLKYRLIHDRGYRFPLMIDVANGYTYEFQKFLAKVRKEFPNIFIAAGNIATPDILHEFKDSGVDAVKIGIGPGGQCRTRETAGIGIPQLTAVMDCANEADNLGLLTIADGGINEYCDFAKGLGAGADFVMSGSFFGGHNECSGSHIAKDGKAYMQIYGMSSKEAQRIHYGEIKNYRASEGRVSLVECKGPVNETVNEILGSLRSTMTYTNTKSIDKLTDNVTFIKVKDTINRKYEKFTIGI